MENDAFQVVCVCGKALSGRRQERHQEVPCPQCGEPVFVLPRSPWKQSVPTRTQGVWTARDWLLPLSAMGLTVVFLVFLFVRFVLPWGKNGDPVEPEASVAEQLRSAQTQLARGHFRRARREFEKLLANKSIAAGSAEERAVRLGARESAALADLLSESLEEILARAASTDEHVWPEEFDARYRGRSVLFDATFSRDDAGQFHCTYDVAAGKTKTKLDFANVQLLQRLPLQKSQRLLIALRLDSITLQPGPAWVVTFDKSGGTLLTDPEAARKVCPELVGDETQTLLTQQAKWQGDRP